eukprot:GDKK01035351.1.p1 GENE.GDKK01035351.1~~GDKK01035351.1.p1  ORF type:complete len:199 (-),score=2.93 GDKK01035351.1:763-1359(-)
MTIKNKIKILREMTGSGVLDCKNAIMLSNFKYNEAIKIVREKELIKIYKILSNPTKENVISNYCHHNSSLGVLLKLSCQTDFVAKNQKFLDLGYYLAKQIAILKDTKYLSFLMVPKKILSLESLYYNKEKKAIIQKNNINLTILKLKFIAYNLKPKILLKQPAMFKEEINIENYIVNHIAIFGENIRLNKFIKYSSKE